MLDPELKSELDQVNANLSEVKQNSRKTGIWRSFFNGMFGAFGYLVGLMIIVVILGWILQKTGLLKPLQEQINTFGSLIEQAKSLVPKNQTQTAPGSNNVQTSTSTNPVSPK